MWAALVFEEGTIGQLEGLTQWEHQPAKKRNHLIVMAIFFAKEAKIKFANLTFGKVMMVIALPPIPLGVVSTGNLL